MSKSVQSYKSIIAVGIGRTPVLINSEHPEMYEILGQMDNLLENQCETDLVAGLYECKIRIDSWQDQTPDSCDWNMEVYIEDPVLINACELVKLEVDDSAFIDPHEVLMNKVVDFGERMGIIK